MKSVLTGLALPFSWLGTLSLWLFGSALPWAWKRMGGQKQAGSLGRDKLDDDKSLKASGRLAATGMKAMCTSSLKPVYCDREASLITIGQKGLGKTQSMIAMVKGIKDLVPVTLNVQGATVKKQNMPDLVVYDPKTGVLKASRADLESMGYHIMVIDIRKPDVSEALYDPLSILDPTDTFDYDRQIQGLASLLSPEAVHGKHDHFESYPRIMISGAIKHSLSQGRQTLAGVVTRLVIKSERNKMFKEMEVSRDVIIQAAVEAFQAAGDKEMGSFITTNFDKLKIWLRPSVKWITEGSGNWTAEDVKKLNWKWETVFDKPEPVAVFVIGGLGTGEGDLVRMIIGNAINSAKRRFNETEKPLRKPLWLLVDECKTLGNCDAVMHVNRELREAGLCLAMWWLSYEDGKKTYPDWETLLSGCDKIVYGNSGDMEWYGKVSRELGKETIQTRSESESDRSKGKGRHEASRNVMDDTELAAMAFHECVGIFRSRNGIKKVRGRKLFTIDEKKGPIYH